MDKKLVRLNGVAVKKVGNEFVETEEVLADFIVIPREDYFRMLDELGAEAIVLNTAIGGSFNTQCPDCGFVAEGFGTEEEAAAWTCDECQPLLPLDD